MIGIVGVHVGQHHRVAGGHGYALEVHRGQRVHIVNTLGQQVVDTWALGLPDGGSRLSMSHTRLAIGRISPRTGDVLLDHQRKPMLHLVEDDSEGSHDTLIPACDAQRYRSLGYKGEHANCADNYRAAVTAYGFVTPTQIPDPLNLFMAVPVTDGGELTLQPSVAPAGSQVVFEAEQDVLLIVSACPQNLVPINGEDCQPKLIDLHTDDRAVAAAPARRQDS